MISHNVEYYDSVSSTMTVAKKRAQESAPSGTWIVANEQTTGKGRLGREWLSERQQGLFTTLILRPQCDVLTKSVHLPHLPQLSLVCGVSLAEIVRAMGVDNVFVGWPNDVFIRCQRPTPPGQPVYRKLAGILLESFTLENGEAVVLVGLGVNIAEKINVVLPEAIRERYIGLQDCLQGCSFLELRQSMLRSLQDVLTKNYENWLTHGFANTHTHFKTMDAYRDCHLLADLGGTGVDGIGEGINHEGGLCIRTPTGLRTVYTGEVKQVRMLSQTSA